MLGDIRNPRLLWLKAGLFVLLGLIAGGIILLGQNDLWAISQTAALLIVCVWSFCRAYYFAFYVLEHYADPSFRYAGLMSLVRYIRSARRQ